ncbi:MAG: glycosyltransferase family 2 protein [Aureliella sp.]
MFVTVIICTLRRAVEVVRLLDSLRAQTHAGFEVIVVDGSGTDNCVRDAIATWTAAAAPTFDLQFVPSARGLTRQRNVGLRLAKGDAIFFLDDDVTVPPEFISSAVAALEMDAHRDVGGITGYDTANYPAEVSLRWRLRKRWGVVASLEPGFADRLGRNAPLSFARPFSGFRQVHWLPGFCMLYRRAAIEGLVFDEQLPTYGGEDRDFSMRVGQSWRLLMCGDLHLQHHCSQVNRVQGTGQVFQTAYGIGRGFKKRARGLSDAGVILSYALREFAIEVLAGVRHPSAASLRAPWARMHGLLSGWLSRTDEPVTGAAHGR